MRISGQYIDEGREKLDFKRGMFGLVSKKQKLGFHS
jgi:hypothetical protein